MTIRADNRNRMALLLAAALVAVTVAPMLSIVGCEAACSLNMMPIGHCGHSTMSAGSSSDAGTAVFGIPMQHGTSVLSVLVMLFLVVGAPSRALLRDVPVDSPVDLKGTRIRI